MSAGTAFATLRTTIRTEGAILPPDILNRIAAGDKELGGLTEAAYHLTGEKFGEATNRAWNRLQSAWLNFQTARASLSAGDAGTTIARERWLLPLFQLLDYGRLQIAKAQEIGGKTYAISHAWQHIPIHLVGCNIDLDSRHRGTSPHSLLQEFLNRSEGRLWGMVSDGLRLRLLRDNISLTRQAYVEFDLEAMMAGEAYPDFVLLWLLLHQSRFEGERPELAWIEKWSQAARTEGVRVLDGLRDGVQRAIESLGQGALGHAGNTALREALRSGSLDKQDYYRELLRLVYRLIFLFVAEDRNLLLDPSASAEARGRYTKHYAIARIRRLAVSKAGSRHDDLYRALKFVMTKLSSDGCPELALPALGSFLFSPKSMPHLDQCEISNRDLLAAVRSLAVTLTKQGRRGVDYKNLGAEELGSVYESLLELHPSLDTGAGTFSLDSAAGSERKKTGSYYTPTSLISCLLDSALDPVIADAERRPNPERAILTLKVVDPACGSGHFLIAAAHRIAKRLAAVRTGEEEPPPEAQRKALRDVIGRCIYGVDLNPMAVELCKVSLWMEAMESGRPLSFLEHRIQPGNSLLGATPRLLANGIPDEAFQPIEGDTKEACAKWRKVNKSERKAAEIGAAKFAFEAYPWLKIGNFAQSLLTLDNLADDTIENVRAKATLYEEAVRSGDYVDGKLFADAWCASFVWPKNSLYDYPITEEIFRCIERNPHGCERAIRDGIELLAGEYSFFHWHLAFPDVFRIPEPGSEAENDRTGWSGGFDLVLGNPPWEMQALDPREYFAAILPEIAQAANMAARNKLIEALSDTSPVIYSEFLRVRRTNDALKHFVHSSGRYPLTSFGRINLAPLFVELAGFLVSGSGYSGLIVPSGIATDSFNQYFFRSLVDGNRLVSLYDFENAVGLFEGVGHGRFKFCLLTLHGAALPEGFAPTFVFFAHHVEDLSNNERQIKLSADDIALINPNTRTCPIFRTRRDADLTKAIYRRIPVLVNEETGDNPWGVSFSLMFMMNTASNLFRTKEKLLEEGWRLSGNIFDRDGERYLPLYEAKMMHQFQHRYGDYAMRAEGSLDSELPRIPALKLDDPDYVVQPRYWVPEWEVAKTSSRVPQGLARAVEEQSEERARQIMSVWLAGYALNHDRVEDIEELVAVDGRAHSFESVCKECADWDAAKSLERQFPLGEQDVGKLHVFGSFLEAAGYLLRAGIPKWLLGFRDVTNATNERTSIFSALPPVAVGHKAPLIFLRSKAECFLPMVNSFVFDYVTRQNMGGTSLGFFVLKQLAVLHPDIFETDREVFIRPRVLELTYTGREISGFAKDLGYAGTPFHWNPERRFLIRCELDALYFHLYGITRDEVAYILDTFPIVRRKDEAEHGEYRTKRVILEIYDAMAEAERTGVPYKTRLDPPPADPRVAHPSIAEVTEQL
jgi:hypothetical protein